MQSTKKILHSLNKYVAIGFDVDHCLVRYRLNEYYPLLYQSIAKTLVEKKGYPDEILNFGKREKSYIYNGLVVDYKTGFTMKLGQDKVILRAYYGFERVPQEVLEAKYGNPPRFDVFNPYKPRTEAYNCCLTYFESFVPTLLAHMIEHRRKTHHRKEISVKELLVDMQYALTLNYAHYDDLIYHHPKEFGNYFPSVAQHLDKVIYKQDKMKSVLTQLKQKGKVLFVVSNSHYDYIDMLMGHAFGDDWKNTFDFIVAKACKPKFFHTQGRTFYEIDANVANRVGKATQEILRNQFFSDGNAWLLEENIQKLTSANGVDGRILFFGDNYSTDILAAESRANWDGVCVMEELGGIDLGIEPSESFWGEWHHDETPYGNMKGFWFDYMNNNAAKCTPLIDSLDMAKFYELNYS